MVHRISLFAQSSSSSGDSVGTAVSFNILVNQYWGMDKKLLNLKKNMINAGIINC
jgi:hypothetical protein